VTTEIIRRCALDDATALAEIYDPIVANTVISFEETPPGPNEMRRRIAAGSGTTVADVNQLVKQFAEMRKLMKQMGSMAKSGRLPRLPGMPGLPGM